MKPGSRPDFPGRPALRPEPLEEAFFAERVDRLPETLMTVGKQISGLRQPFERLAFPTRAVSLDEVEDRGLEHEETAIDPAGFVRGLAALGVRASIDDYQEMRALGITSAYVAALHRNGTMITDPQRLIEIKTKGWENRNKSDDP